MVNPEVVHVVMAHDNYKKKKKNHIDVDDLTVFYIKDYNAQKPETKAQLGSKAGLVDTSFIKENCSFIEFPLHSGCRRRERDFVIASVKNGVSCDVSDSSGSLPLHLAVEIDDEELVKTVIAATKCPNLKNKIGMTPLHKAALKGHTSVVSLLLQNGVNPSEKDLNGKTPLDYASNRETAAILKLNVFGNNANIKEYLGSSDEDS